MDFVGDSGEDQAQNLHINVKTATAHERSTAPTDGAGLLRTRIELGHGRSETLQLRILGRLGRGRAAQALLVRTDDGREIVEKHFDPTGLTRAIYTACFGAPFAYDSDRDAALALTRSGSDELTDKLISCNVLKGASSVQIKRAGRYSGAPGARIFTGDFTLESGGMGRLTEGHAPHRRGSGCRAACLLLLSPGACR